MPPFDANWYFCTFVNLRVSLAQPNYKTLFPKNAIAQVLLNDLLETFPRTSKNI